MKNKLKKSLLDLCNDIAFKDLSHVITHAFYSDARKYASATYQEIKDGRGKRAEAAVQSLSDSITKRIQEVVENSSLDSTFFPPNTKRISKVGEMIYVAIEQSPQTRFISFSDLGRFRLSFPYIQFHFEYNQNARSLRRIFVTCTKKPYSSLKDRLFDVPLPNIANGEVCMGDMSFVKGDLITCVNDYILKFWSSKFNGSSSDSFFNFGVQNGCEKINNHRGILDWWVGKTEDNPLFVLNAVYNELDQTRETYIKDVPSIEKVAISDIKKQLAADISNIAANIAHDISNSFDRKPPELDQLEPYYKARLIEMFSSIFETAFNLIREDINNDQNSEKNKLIAAIVVGRCTSKNLSRTNDQE